MHLQDGMLWHGWQGRAPWEAIDPTPSATPQSLLHYAREAIAQAPPINVDVDRCMIHCGAIVERVILCASE